MQINKFLYMKNIDNNLNFLKRYQPELFRTEKIKVKRTADKLNHLAGDQRTEWVQIIERKCHELHKQFLQNPHNESYLKMLMQNLSLLLQIVNEFRCEYDKEGIESILKSVYYREKVEKDGHSQVLKCFEESGFSIEEYDFLIYEEPWYTKVYRWFTE